MDYKEYPKTKARDDFWGQVRRTLHGVPVSQEQIDMIVKAIRDSLLFSPDDILLDLGCGNGALSKYFFDSVSQFRGIDFSKYLISVAKEYFEEPPHFTFQEQDIVSYVNDETNIEHFTKCLCYGVFSYLSFKDAEVVLGCLTKHFRSLQTIFIGNLPDKERSHLFYPEDVNFSQLLDDSNSPIGIWRSKNDFLHLIDKTGWQAKFHMMPDSFYAAHYRYDVVLRRYE